MGAATSCLGPSASGLTSSLKRGDERAVLRNLEANPCLLSTRTNRWSLLATTPLHVACKRKRVEAVQEVLLFLSSSPLEVVREALVPYCRRSGLSLPTSVPEGVWMAVNMANARGETPLMYACYAGCPELVKLLLAHGADPWLGDYASSRKALHYAAVGADSVACIKVLLKELPAAFLTQHGVRYVDSRTNCGLTALHYLLYCGDLAAIRELLRHGPNLNAVTSSDVLVTCEAASTPLHFAAVRGNLEAARELLQYYARCSVANPGYLADPRTLANIKQQLPWQVAISLHPTNRALAALLHPSQTIQDALAAVPGASADPHGPRDPRTGPPSLVAIAAAALKAKLEAEVRNVECGMLVIPAEGTSSMRSTAVGVVAPPPSPLAAASEQVPACSKVADEACRAGGGQVAWPAVSIDRAGTSQGATKEGAAGPESLAQCKGTSYAFPSDPYNRFSDASCCSGADLPGFLEDDGDQEGVCGVCFAAPQAVAPVGCGHGVCVECAAKLCRGIRAKPLRCPFCRKRVTGFVIFGGPATKGATELQSPEQQQQPLGQLDAKDEEERHQAGKSLQGQVSLVEGQPSVEPVEQRQQANE